MRQTKQFLTLTRATAKRSLIAMLVATLTMTTACEKPIIDEGSVVSGSAADANVILRFTQYEHEAFSASSGSAAATRAATDITELCSRINIAIFDGEGSKVKTVAQKGGMRRMVLWSCRWRPGRTSW